MTYNPAIHHRRSIRLKGYDYAQAGAYFITICCDNRLCRFGEIAVGAGLAPAPGTPNGQYGHPDLGHPQGDAPTCALNEYGQIAYDEWVKLPERFPGIELDAFQIMPNHMHGIIILNDVVGAGLAPALDSPNAPTNPTIGDVVGAYKSLVTNRCLEIYKTKNKMMGRLWQRNYYEHIIRTNQSYQHISQYIIDNPAKWNEDKFFTL